MHNTKKRSQALQKKQKKQPSRADFMIKLVQNRQFPEDRLLSLYSCNLYSLDLAHITKKSWKHLLMIKLGHNNIGDVGLKYLALGNWRHLQLLNLNNNRLGNSAIRNLSEGRWPALLVLDLQNNRISPNSFLYLVKGDWPLLDQVNISNNFSFNFSHVIQQSIPHFSLDFY